MQLHRKFCKYHSYVVQTAEDETRFKVQAVPVFLFD
jgi:hypothetical protein